MMIRLDIPYRSQHENSVRNDCGAACVAMLAGTTVDEVLDTLRQRANRPLTFTAVMRALRIYGLDFEFVRPLRLPRIKSEIVQGRPLIVLAAYTAVAEPQSSFDGAHFFLAVGCNDGGVFVHDPNWRGDREAEGRYLYLEDGRLEAAMRQPGWGNRPYQGVVIRDAFPFVQEADVDVEVAEAAEDVDWRERALLAEAIVRQMGELIERLQRDFEALARVG